MKAQWTKRIAALLVLLMCGVVPAQAAGAKGFDFAWHAASEVSVEAEQTPAQTTTGMVYLVKWTGTLNGTNLALTGALTAATVTANQPGITTVSTDGFVAANATAATAAVPVQQSPRFRLRSNVWNTTATAASNTDDWWIQSTPVSGAVPKGGLDFVNSANGVAGSIIASLNWQNNGWALNGVNLIRVCVSNNTCFQSGGIGFQLTNQAGNTGIGLTAYGIAVGNGGRQFFDTLPTVTSAGTSPSIVGSGSITMRVNVGTGGTATTIVLAMPTATTGWNCMGSNLTAAAANRAAQGAVLEQSSTVSAVTMQQQTLSTGVALPFAASDIVLLNCVAY